MILAFKPIFVDKINKGIKIHTFREDSKDRWHPSREIQMATGVRTKNYNQFNEGICGGTQRIIIYATLVGCPTVVVDNRTLDPTETL